MSTADFGATPRIVLSSKPVQAARSRKQNEILARVIIGVIALAPLPLGSHRPFFWLMWGMLIGLAAAVYGYSILRSTKTSRFSLASVGVSVTLFAIFCAYLVFQVLPLGLGAPIVVGSVTLPTVMISIAPTETVMMLIRQVTYALFAFFVLEVTVRDSRRSRLVRATLLVICAYAIWGLVSLRLGDTILGIPKWAYLGSVTSTYVNRNSFATLIAFGVAIAIALLLAAIFEDNARRNPGRIVLYVAALVVLFATAVATQSRMGLFVCVAAAVTVSICGMLRMTASRRAVAGVVAIMIGVVALAFFLFGGGLFDRLSSLDLSSEVRSNFYIQILDLIRLRPLTGFGGGTFEQAFPLVHQPPVSPELIWDHGHNTYLTLWVEAGLIFGSVPILIYVIAFVRILIAIIRSRDGWLEQSIALGVMVAGGLHSLLDFSLEIQANTFVFVALVAIGLGSAIRRTSPG